MIPLSHNSLKVLHSLIHKQVQHFLLVLSHVRINSSDSPRQL